MNEWTRVVMLATRLSASEARKIVTSLPDHVLSQFPCPPVRDTEVARPSILDLEAGRPNEDLETLLYLMSLDIFKG